MTLPAGLIDERIEFFSDPRDHDVCYALTGGRVVRVKDLSPIVKLAIWENLKAHPAKLAALFELGFAEDDAMLEKYCSCNFGLFDGTPDFENGHFNHEEYVDCPVRCKCPVNGILCNPLTINGSALTHRQSSVLRLIGRCMLNKEIAGHLGISPETVKIHIKHIQRVSGLQNKKDLVLLAHKKQLL